ncbi:hypothetical protein, partial [Streptomyces sp. NPDC002564]|uniref:hypothetical protein n=1 Tax=Streptomyces sp. NPDC002564 TaxID=3364649 RepID=UPI0036C7D8EB
ALPFGVSFVLAFPTLPDPFSVPFPVRISFPVAVGGLCLSADPTLSEVFGRSYRLQIPNDREWLLVIDEIQEAGRL